MQHMVIFRSAEGKPDYHQADDLDGAVKFVEYLRNDKQVTDARIFRMQEVAIEVKTYYRVEVAEKASSEVENAAPSPKPAPPAPPSPDTLLAPPPVAAPADELLAASAGTPSSSPSSSPGSTPSSSPNSDLAPRPVPTGNSRFGLFGRT